jgi:hypothetical protein
MKKNKEKLKTQKMRFFGPVNGCALRNHRSTCTETTEEQFGVANVENY